MGRGGGRGIGGGGERGIGGVCKYFHLQVTLPESEWT